MRVLITGGAGFIGSHLADALVDRGDVVLIVDDLSRGRAARVDKRASLREVSVTQAPALSAAVREFRPELICHLAAQIDVRNSIEDPAYDSAVNVVGTINVLETAKLAGARVLFASSGGAMYGHNARIPSPEETPPTPESPYGVAKLCAEHYVNLYNQLHGARHSVLRLANVYGPRQDPAGEAGVIALFCASALAGGTPVIYGDGTQTRDYVFVGDVVRSFLAAADCGYPGTWNIGTGVETSVLELVDIIADVAGHAVVPRHGPSRPGELDRSAVAPGRAARDLNWQSAVNLQDGIRAVYQWIKDGTPDACRVSEVLRSSST
jgi:UDP-glucose 4-epimerase